jgi:hypothetical protein
MELTGTHTAEARDDRYAWMLHLASVAGTIVFDLAAAGVILVLVHSGKILGLGADQGEEKEEKEVQFVVATLVKLGTPADPSAPPHRKVPALATGPKGKIPVSTELNPPEVQPADQETAPSFAVDDPKLRKIFDTARAFAEISDHPMVEGLPDGVPEGEVTDPALVKAGDMYATKLYRIFKNLWVVPSLISQKEREGLVVKVRVVISPGLKISDYKIVKKSGNSQFDGSVVEIFKKFDAEGKTLPEPPDEIASKLFEGGLVIRFHGKDYGK